MILAPAIDNVTASCATRSRHAGQYKNRRARAAVNVTMLSDALLARRARRTSSRDSIPGENPGHALAPATSRS